MRLLELPLAGADECDGAEPTCWRMLVTPSRARQPPPRRVTCALLDWGDPSAGGKRCV